MNRILVWVLVPALLVFAGWAQEEEPMLPEEVGEGVVAEPLMEAPEVLVDEVDLAPEEGFAEGDGEMPAPGPPGFFGEGGPDGMGPGGMPGEMPGGMDEEYADGAGDAGDGGEASTAAVPRRRERAPFPTARAQADPEAVAPTPSETVQLNFRDVPLDTVLDYLSQAAGFIIVRDVEVSGTVTVWSHQALNTEEAVNLLNTILNNRGYAAIRQGRTLTIVDRDSAAERSIPVKMGSDPEGIPQTDVMVTQIIPVRYADVKQLLENIQELLPDYAVATINESTNAIVLTDTQANVRRMAEIVTALDDSISGITEMKVYHLNNADAEETATLINQVFQVKDTGRSASGSSRSGRGGPGEFFARMRGGGPPGGGDNGGSGESAARRAASNVVAVADTRSNSVVVAAPGDMMPLVTDLVDELDGLPEELPVMRVFPLQYADAEETADLISALFNPASSGSSRSRSSGSQRFAGGPGDMMRAMMERMGRSGRSTGADEATVQAVADVRTNSVVVTAIASSMTIVAQMVDELDANPAKDRKVFVYPLENADAEEVADILQQTFGGTSTGRSSTSRSTGGSTRGTVSSSRTSGFGGSSQRSTGR